MDIKDNELFRLEDRMLFEAAAAAQIVAAADAAQNASDDGNNDEEKHNNDMNVALFVAPEAQNDNDAANNVADVDAQAKALVEGDLPAMDDSISIIPAVDANANTDVDTDAQLDAHQDFVEGTLHADNADTFTVDADADADHDILGNWLANDDIDDNADTLSVDGAVAAIAAEHTVIDIDADADADSDDFDADTRAGNHELSLDFSAHKTYDGTTDVEDGELQLDASFDGIELSVFGTYQSQEGSWIFTFNDTANQSYIVTTKNVVFDGSSVTTDSITIGSFYITGENVDNIDLFVNGEELPNTRAGELRADGTIDQRDITLSVRDARMTYGDDENSLKFQYEISEGSLIEGDSVFARYALSSDLDAYRTDSGHIQYNPDPYADAIKFDEVKTQIYDFDGNKVTENYNINFDNGSLTVAQRVLSVTIKPYTVDYGEDLGTTPAYDDEGYTFDGNALALGDTLIVNVGYNITDQDVSSAGFVKAGLHPGMLVEASHELTNASNYIYGVNPGNLTVNAKGITVDYVAANKIYDGNTDALRDTEAGFIFSEALFDGDVVRIFDNAVDYTFASSDVGTGIEVTASDDFVIVGPDADSYDIHINLVSQADITPKDVTITFTAEDRAYDGDTDATLADVQIEGVIKDGDVTIDADQMTFAFSDKNVGDDKTVTAEGYSEELLGGAKLQNYNVTFVDTTEADITPLLIEIGFSANDKVYDGNTEATRDQLDMSNVLPGDDVSFDDSSLVYNFSDKNVGEEKTVTAEGYDDSLLSGKDVANYDFIFVDTALADITPLEITIGFTAADKKYDGNTIAERVDLIMDEVLEGDDVSFDDSGIEYNFDTKEPGEGKTVTATGFDADTMLSGNDLANYDITFIDTTTANITYLTITIIADDKSMTYGDSEPALTYTYEGDLAEGHMVSVEMSLNIDAADITDTDHIKVNEYVDSITAVATIYDENGAVVTGDYDIIYDFGDLTVTKRNITVTAQAQEMIYGEDMPDLAGQYTFDENALASGDTLDVTLDYDIQDNDVSTSGNVTAGLHSGMVVEASHDLSNDENYNYTFNAASLNVLPKDVTIIFNAKDKVYDGNTDAERDGAFILDGFVDGDKVNVFDNDVTYSFSDKNVGEDKTVTADGELVTVGADVDNYNFTFDNTAEADITPLAIEIGFTANDKVYDGNTTAERVDLIMDQVLEGDDVSFDDSSLEYNFDTKNVGEDKTVTATGYSEELLSGADLQNYEITFVDTTTADITKLAIEIGFTANNKVYDGNTEATRDELDMSAVLEGDDVSFDDSSLEYNFDTKNVGEDKTVTATGYSEKLLSGEDLQNYDVTFVDTTTANITPLAIEIGFTAKDKIYDGNTVAERDELDMSAVLEGDDVSFDDSSLEYNFDTKNVGEDKTVTAEGYSEKLLSGEDLQNYDVTFVDTALADITPLAIEIGFTAADKKYDGNTIAERVDLIMDEVLEGDDVSFDDSGIEYNFDTKEPGEGKTVTATGFDADTMLSGNDLAN
ncbi:MAG: hypothetical protein IKS67_09030, partial [Victivallales bacterium]|nr:hypothetical protein [Victivallales bacterium]